MRRDILPAGAREEVFCRVFDRLGNPAQPITLGAFKSAAIREDWERDSPSFREYIDVTWNVLTTRGWLQPVSYPKRKGEVPSEYRWASDVPADAAKVCRRRGRR